MSALANLLKDPPPSHVFEFSEGGIAFARLGRPPQIGFEPLPDGAITASPVHDNIQQPELLQASIRALAPPNGGRKRRAALIIPDYAARIAVLDFDAFPDSHQEQLALVRFRIRKSVPFDIESAMVSYYAQPKSGTEKRIEVVAAVIALEIVARYEAPLRAANFQPGLITTSALAALNLLEPDGVTMLAKLSGRTLTALALDGARLKLARCLEMERGSEEEIDSILHPTLAYIEDELGATPKRVFACGFGPERAGTVSRWGAQWGVRTEPLRSRFDVPGETNAGLLGYLETMEG